MESELHHQERYVECGCSGQDGMIDGLIERCGVVAFALPQIAARPTCRIALDSGQAEDGTPLQIGCKLKIFDSQNPLCYTLFLLGRIAQQVRALPLQGRGSRFESWSAHFLWAALSTHHWHHKR